MEIIHIINHLLGDNLKQIFEQNSKLKISESCFSIYSFEGLNKDLENIELLEFMFSSPTLMPNKITDKIKKERSEFHILKAELKRGFYGSDFEIQLKNKLTKRAYFSLAQ